MPIKKTLQFCDWLPFCYHRSIKPSKNISTMQLLTSFRLVGLVFRNNSPFKRYRALCRNGTKNRKTFVQHFVQIKRLVASAVLQTQTKIVSLFICKRLTHPISFHSSHMTMKYFVFISRTPCIGYCYQHRSFKAKKKPLQRK